MLRAYDYIDYSENAAQTFHMRHFDEELQIAENIVRNLTTESKKNTGAQVCLCGQKKLPLFFEKWGVGYYCCPRCRTIVVGADAQHVNVYKKNMRLIEFRTSSQYQSEAAERRKKTWDELLNWVYFRAFRYLNMRVFNILDYANRYTMLAKKIENSNFCGGYELRNAIIDYHSDKPFQDNAMADVVLNFNNIQQSIDPVRDIKRAGEGLRRGGLMFFSTRIGTGFDILVLREHSKIFPFEHTFLPSILLLNDIFSKNGFKVLETTTPGTLDTVFVKNNKDKISEYESFVRYMMDSCDMNVLQDFQRFLQKSTLSSYTQFVVRKETD